MNVNNGQWESDGCYPRPNLGPITEIPKERSWEKRHGVPMGKTPWGAHGHSPPAGMKIFPISKTASIIGLRNIQ